MRCPRPRSMDDDFDTGLRTGCGPSSTSAFVKHHVRTLFKNVRLGDKNRGARVVVFHPTVVVVTNEGIVMSGISSAPVYNHAAEKVHDVVGCAIMSWEGNEIVYFRTQACGSVVGPAFEVHDQDLWPFCDFQAFGVRASSFARVVGANVIVVARFW